MSHIAVDLTPLQPGGVNGGAKPLVLQILTNIQKLNHSYKFLLLTAGWNHEELAGLDGPRMERLCVLPDKSPPTETIAHNRHYELLDSILNRLRQLLPPQAISQLLPPAKRLKQKLRFWLNPPLPPNALHYSLRARGVELLFCPFTAPTYAEPGILVVSVVHDLQHRAYPYFLSPHEIRIRDEFFAQLSQKADVVVCVSEYSRSTLLSHYDINPERAQVIYNSIEIRLAKFNSPKQILVNLGVAARPYLFYPANFWRHKNHQMLLTAYNILIERNQDLELDLVFTGASTESEKELLAAVETMGLKDRVHFLGYLSDEQLVAVFQGCKYLIHPSLYEGFGIPLLEAFAFGKPVLCSDVASLPEIGGEAALYFDPRKPTDIVQAIETLLRQPHLAQDLVQRGYERLAQFRQEGMAHRYLEIFNQTLQQHKTTITDGLEGIFADGWFGSRVEISYSPHCDSRTLELILMAPPLLPYRKIYIKHQDGMSSTTQWKLSRGQTISLHFPLSPEGGYITLNISPVFKPSKYEIANDERFLSCLCQACRIIYPDGAKKVLFAMKEPKI
jgi:glycosyltransferase involved in cell wall biosynthesis